ncbi:MAG TPA: hypothetical protein VLE72_04620 [Candidatus Saccharimonadales bacterium]|nr:hypothetical protein [Candidatus Saccharimonadales bacterium]
MAARVCTETEECSYSFNCPKCRVNCAKQCTQKFLKELVDHGAHLEVWHLPAELEEPHHGDPISPDDLLDFHFLLDSPDWHQNLNREVQDSVDRSSD